MTTPGMCPRCCGSRAQIRSCSVMANVDCRRGLPVDLTDVEAAKASMAECASNGHWASTRERTAPA